MSAPVAWIAVDWGMTRLTVWLMDSAGGVIDRRDSADGADRLAPEAFEPALLALVGTDLRAGQSTPILICGAAGGGAGWAEAPCVSVPCAPPRAAQARRVDSSDPRLSVRILPGLRQDHPADVMRGEETRIAGFLALNPGYDGIVCLSGTHSKWAHVSAGEIVSFRSFMTGELFALLTRQSVLRHTVADSGWDDATFIDAVDRAMSRPESLAAGLFGIHALAQLRDPDPVSARAALSGLLIGAELAAAKPYWLGRQVAVLGADDMAQHYRTALMSLSVPVILADAERMTLQGFRVALAGDDPS